ncbi:DUF397 domain-containing protein [Streptomyces avidinii]|uniref:DUF397 domain-containing protein n=1 Tax=Streptomyces avidinii TaxID=1895 RepID=UPI00386D0C7C|nr:DUF397 domain-containing protein [Streptomyces avidinii]
MSAARIDTLILSWRKSTYSDGGGGDCVEVADHIPGAVPVRDSKTPSGPVILVGNAAWSAFVQHVREV